MFFLTAPCRGGFNGRPLVQWPTRPLGGLALEAPGPRGPRKAKFLLAIAKSWLQLELNLWFILTWNEYADSEFCSFRILIKKLVTFWLTICLYCSNCMKFVQLILRKIIKIVTTRCQILRLKCTKFDFGRGSAPDPAGGAYSAPPDP